MQISGTNLISMVDRFWRELAKSAMNPYVMGVLYGSEIWKFGVYVLGRLHRSERL
jgi:hypothetical protein